MKKLLSAILTIIVMAWIIYVPYALSMRLVPFFELPDKTEVGAYWYIVLYIGYFVSNWLAGVAFTAVAGIGVVLIGKLMYHVSQGIYRGILELLEAMEVKE